MRHVVLSLALAVCGFSGAFGQGQSHAPREDERFVDDLRGWLDGKGKGPAVDPKMLRQVLDGLGRNNAGMNQDELRKMVQNNPQFKDPRFLNWLKEQMGQDEFPKNLKKPFVDNEPPPKVIDQDPPPVLKNKLNNFVDEANKGQPVVPPLNGQQNLDNPGPNDPANPAAPPPASSSGPKLDPTTQEWVKWLEKNFGESPAGKEAIKELMTAMSKTDFKNIFDDLPEFKNGDWKQFDQWGKGAFGEGWNFHPPDWHFNWGGGGGGGFTGPNFGGGGGGGSGGLTLGGGGGGGPDAGGMSAVVIVIAVIGALALAAFLYAKWKRDQEAKLAMLAAARAGFSLAHIRTRQELVEAFDALTVEKCGDESRNWNHRVVTKTWADTRPAVAAPAQELADLYQKARYAPPQDDMTGGELTTAERDLRAVAEVNA